MLDPTLLILTGAGLALGATVAQLRGPTCWGWEGHVGDLRQRLSWLPRRAPSAGRRAAGMAALAALLASGAMAAYAAAPSAPDQLPREVRGVVGSGDQLSLKIKLENGQDRTLKLGEVYKEGWTLKALTPSQATLTKAGETRQVGLNPAGIVANLAAEKLATVIKMAGDDDDRLLARAMEAGRWDGQTTRAGLTLAETQRMVVLKQRLADRVKSFTDAIEAQAREDGRPTPSIGMRGLDHLALLADDAPEYARLLNKEMTANYQTAADLYNRLGAVQIVEPGSALGQLMSNYPRGTYVREPDGSFRLGMPQLPLAAQLYPVPDAAHPVAFQPSILYPLPGASQITPAQIIAASPRS